MKNIGTLEELYKQYKPLIYSYFYYQTGNKPISEELCQEVFLKAFKGLQSFRQECSVKTWLYTIAHNLYVSWYRREMKYDMVALDDMEEIKFQSEVFIPEDSIERREKAEKVRKVLNELKEEHKNVLIMCDVMELSYAEIAQLMNWSMSQVKINVYRARIQFKTLFEKEGEVI